MNLLLTGASGFLGRNYLLRAPAGWHILALYHHDASFLAFVEGLGNRNIEVARCDLTNREEVGGVFRQYGREWDSCLYLAAKVDIPWSVRQPDQDLAWNAGSLLNVLDCIRVGKLVYFSSGAVYDGRKGEVPPHAPVAPTLPYAISKLTCERYVEFYSRRRRSIGECLIVRFFGAYGPYEAPHKIYSRLIRAFAIDGEKSYAIYGDGQNVIDAMYVDDAVEAIGRMLAGNHWNDTVNLAGGYPRTIEALVREVGQALGVSSVRIEKQGVANEHNAFWGSTGEMREFFAFEPETTLSEGILRFRDFLCSNGQAPELSGTQAALERHR